MSQYRVKWLTVLLSLLLHLIWFLLTWNMDFTTVREITAKQKAEDIVELFLVPDSQTEQTRPQTYTSTPERHEAEVPPDNPDFLSLRNSRAADRLPGGEEDSRPGTEDNSEVEQVAISRFDPGLATNGVALVEPEQEQSTATPKSGTPERRGQPATDTGESIDPQGRPDSQRDVVNESPETADEKAGEIDPEAAPKDEQMLVQLPNRAAPSILNKVPGSMGDPGFNYEQRASGAPNANMVRFGEYQLNTIDWDFAPWLEQFRRDFMPNWIAPYAYILGVIDGKTMLRLVVKPDGRIGELTVIEKVGHESLHQASTAALRAAAPYAPLPKDFPEENLVIILSLHYPAWK